MMHNAMAMMNGGMTFMLPFVGLGLVVWIIWFLLVLWALVDLVKAKQDAMTKIFWLLVITMAGNLSYSWMGALLYLFARKK